MLGELLVTKLKLLLHLVSHLLEVLGWLIESCFAEVADGFHQMADFLRSFARFSGRAIVLFGHRAGEAALQVLCFFVLSCAIQLFDLVPSFFEALRAFFVRAWAGSTGLSRRATVLFSHRSGKPTLELLRFLVLARTMQFFDFMACFLEALGAFFAIARHVWPTGWPMLFRKAACFLCELASFIVAPGLLCIMSTLHEVLGLGAFETLGFISIHRRHKGERRQDREGGSHARFKHPRRREVARASKIMT